MTLAQYLVIAVVNMLFYCCITRHTSGDDSSVPLSIAMLYFSAVVSALNMLLYYSSTPHTTPHTREESTPASERLSIAFHA